MGHVSISPHKCKGTGDFAVKVFDIMFTQLPHFIGGERNVLRHNINSFRVSIVVIITINIMLVLVKPRLDLLRSRV